jgi:hypothetical protein
LNLADAGGREASTASDEEKLRTAERAQPSVAEIEEMLPTPAMLAKSKLLGAIADALKRHAWAARAARKQLNGVVGAATLTKIADGSVHLL